MKKMIKLLGLVVCCVFISVSIIMAQDYCEGDFDGDLDQDGSDAAVFKSDFGRSQYSNPCPIPDCPTNEELADRIAYLEALLANVTRNGSDITFSGVNVHIVDGSGSTENVNGLGNLIVGYNELRDDGADDRTGSHNIVVGQRHNYSSYGGLVAGYKNNILGTYATISGGRFNYASGNYASVTCGQYNSASGFGASVSGGAGNLASGHFASVSGGSINQASDVSATVCGGENNTSGYINATVCGGGYNTASGFDATVGGGLNRSAVGDYDWAAGDLWQDQ